MQILLTIFVLSIVTLAGCRLYEELNPCSNLPYAAVGILAAFWAFMSGLAAILLLIWS